MKKYSKLNEIRLKNIKPEGWLRKTLQKEMEGMPGNLHKIGHPFNKSCWKYASLKEACRENWWPYEQDGYRIDSIVRCASLLDDMENLNDIVGEDIKQSLSHGSFIGPEELKADVGYNRWPMAVYFRALYALWSKTGDEIYLKKMRDHYLGDDNTYKKHRDVVNIETMLRLYEHFDDERLLKKAIKAIELYNAEESSKETLEAFLGNSMVLDHAVTYNEIAKIYSIIYIYTGNRKYLDAAVMAYERIEKFHMLPDGVNSSREVVSGNETMRLHESCDISDFTWSMGYMLEATGDAKYADRIERAVFNAFFGATAPEFVAVQYFSGVNQVIATRDSIHDKAYLDTPRMQYAPHHYPECCVANIGRCVPNYVLRMYHTSNNSFAVSLYGDSEYEDENISVIQSGNYPYRYRTVLEIKRKTDEVKSLKLRIPSWSCGCRITINGMETDYEVVNGYAIIPVDTDVVTEIIFNPVFESNTSSDGGIYYTYGPFLLSLKIKEQCTVDCMEKRQTNDFPAFNYVPDSPWSYAVSGWEIPQITHFEEKDEPLWSYVPFEIKIKAHELKNWNLVEISGEERIRLLGDVGMDEAHEKEFDASIVRGPGRFMPDIPHTSFVEENLGDEAEITLIPYGCTNLRLTVFPKRKSLEYAK